MATLTETAYFARKGINLGAIFLVLAIIVRLLWGVVLGIKDKYFPPPPPPATVAFGKLPAISAQNNIATPSGITYTLETISGDLPKLPSIAKVFFMPKPGATFGSFEKMKSLAARMSFTGAPQRLEGTMWRFVDSDNPLRTLDIDEISSNFRLVYTYQSDPTLFADKNFTSVDTVVAQAKSFFDNLGLFSSDLKAGTPTTANFRFDAGALVPTTALSDADAVWVTFHLADIDEFPVVSPDARSGLISVLFSGSTDQKKKVLEARYFYGPIDQENWATYPVITSQQALDRLIAGQAIFASLPTPVGKTITIREVFLAYLSPYPQQKYLQPVFVFSDQKGFMAYVPIITAEWSE